MAENEMTAMRGMPLRVRLSDGLGVARAGRLRNSGDCFKQGRSRIVVAAAMLDDDAHAAFLPPTRARG